MEIRQLQHAVAIVDQGGFSAAADEVGHHPARPVAVDRHPGAGAGLQLFVRGRQVVLTAAGEAFLGPARQVLRAATAVRDVAADVTGLRSGRLDLVALPTLAVDPLAELLGRFRAAHPGISVRVAAPTSAWT